MTALGGGQYSYPDGLKFGGSEPSWSNKILRGIVQEHLAHARRIGVLDWHTGIWGYGEIFPIVVLDDDTQELELTANWWGRGCVFQGRSSWSFNANQTDMPAPEYTGLTWNALTEHAGIAKLAGGIVEFGAVNFETVAQAVILDYWLSFHALENEDVRLWRAQMRLWFAPRDGLWESAVISHATTLNNAALLGLIDWSKND